MEKLHEKNSIHKLYTYIFVFLIIFCIIFFVTTLFYANLKHRQNSTNLSSDYTNLNLYFLKAVKTSGVKIKRYGLVNDDLQSYFIVFENTDGTQNTFIKQNDIIYYNKIKLCENVDSFKVIVDRTGRESISVEVVMHGKTYTSQYVIE